MALLLGPEHSENGSAASSSVDLHVCVISLWLRSTDL